MRSPRSSPTSLLLPIAGVAVLLLAGVAVYFLMHSEDEGPAGQQKVATRTAEPAALPEFQAAAPPERDTKPIEVPVDAGHLPLDAPIVALAGDAAGGISGMVVDKSRHPVEGVKLTVFRGNALLGGSAFPGTRQQVETSATSGADGRYELKRIPVGQPYVVVGEHDDFARSEVSGVRVQKNVVTPDVVLIMTEGAVITGMVTAKDSGPISNARVELYYQLDMAFLKPEDQRPSRVVFTDSTGRFAFTHVSSSSIRVRVSADGFESQSRTVSYALEPEPRDENLTFELNPGSALPGRVVTDRGAPVPRARVEVSSLTRDVQSTSVAVSDEGGNFLLEGIGASTYQLRATCPGFSDKVIQHVEASAGNVLVEMTARGAAQGKVSSLSGKGIPSFTLHLMKSAPGRDPNYLSDSRRFSAPDGTFVFDDLDPGDYVLEARADDWADTRSDPFTVASGGDAPTTVNITMSKGGTLRGTIKTADGKPASGAMVSLNENNFQDNALNQIFKSIAPDDTRERHVKAGGDGSYAFEQIPPGVYQVSGSAEESAPVVVNDVNIVDDALGGNKPLDLVLPPGAVIAGHAVSAARHPLAFCKVQISQKDTGFMDVGTTDNDGGFTFRNLRSGEYQITVTPTKDDEDKPIHPFLQLVQAQKSMQKIFVSEGQVVDGVLITLGATSN